MEEIPRWIDHDTIMVPATAIGDGVIGDGAVPIDAADSRFALWADWLVEAGQPRPERVREVAIPLEDPVRVRRLADESGLGDIDSNT